MLFTRSLSLCKYLSFPAHLHFSFNYVGTRALCAHYVRYVHVMCVMCTLCALCARYVCYVHGVPVHVEARGV